MLRIPVGAIILFCAALAVAGESPTAEEARLEQQVGELINAHRGRVAVAIRLMPSGRALAWNADEPMPTASLIKVAVMIEAYRQADAGRLDLTKMLTLQEEQKVPGSGVLTGHFSPGLQLSLRDAVRLMIAFSDNTATNLVLDEIGLPSTAETMERLGFPNTKIHSKVYRRDTSVFPERSEQFGLGSTTADEMRRLLEQLWRGELAMAESSEAMRGHLRACESKATLPRFLPAGTKVAHKTGSVDASRTSAGVIESPRGPIVVVVLTAGNEDRRWTPENEGELLCARVAQAAYEAFNPAPPDEP